ncbi:prokineticin-2 isoform X2 [Cynoglossus semilaevis]|uniref:Prokineticin 2 n=1 Tax=Cynoglossus semilaevis TaxID=244447 RepID=A0A3P8VI05_CYNSE|nr:prokineticin-2 isoform X2 [Cynoglossus semilaevis]XP_024916215.1 prokineticin-2 isoform X2 [Cynoglossus semilaevis]
MMQWPLAHLAHLFSLKQSSLLFTEDAAGTQGKRFIMRSFLLLIFSLLLVSQGSSAIITGVCELDSQCGGGMCCAVSLWIGSLRMCTTMGQEGDDCHPMSHKVPFFGKRLHHSCPCLPNLSCIATDKGRHKCVSPVSDYFF